ncbi:MAG: RagB/SusD family nutrient uptake outer membrane protein [Bacteroidetes bacterium]|nr:RagB/SusD family nutrient uptake outer membrane protein [Bacteroidota bacterium]
MKFIIKIFLILVVAGSMASACNKQFLDLKPPASIPTNEAIVDESSMTTAVNGMYSALRNVDFFGRSIPIDGDLMADNIYIDPVQNSNRYLIDMTYTYTETYGNIQNTWSEAYNAILRANNIINATVASSATVDQLRGEALTIRALCYFELIKWFAKPYTVSPTSPGVPIVLTYDPFAKPARNTVAEVYTQIEKDLTDAVNLLDPANDKNSSYVTQLAAQALLARFYQFKGDWGSAGTVASNVVSAGKFTLADSSGLSTYWSNPFPVSNGLETIFEVEFDNVNNNGTDNLSNFYDQAGYGDALCTDDLYFTYSATDARRGLIQSENRGGRAVWVVHKYPNTTNVNGKDASKIIRYAEVLLILAEAYARVGDNTNAQITLNTLAQKRDPQFAGYSSTGNSLLNDIYNERRKELAFEGHRYWDYVRANQAVVRQSISQYGPGVPATLPAGSNKRIWPIPRAELNANSNITQNPGY